jgi:hypothetical protein
MGISLTFTLILGIRILFNASCTSSSSGCTEDIKDIVSSVGGLCGSGVVDAVEAAAVDADAVVVVGFVCELFPLPQAVKITITAITSARIKMPFSWYSSLNVFY